MGVRAVKIGIVGDGAVERGRGLGDVSPVIRVVSCRRLWTWLSVSGAKGEPGDGLFKACRMSRMQARMRSLEEASGIVTFLGNHEMVSQILSV